MQRLLPHSWPLLLIAAVIIGVLAKQLGPRRRHDRKHGLYPLWPLEPKRNLLSEGERELFRRLTEALPHHLVFAQVQLLQVLNFKQTF